MAFLSNRRVCRYISTNVFLRQKIQLHFEEVQGESGLAPLVIAHGMLGSCNNWTSLSKSINRQTGRRIITFDARNHGASPHSGSMDYDIMSKDAINFIQEDLGIEKAVLMGKYPHKF